MTEVATLATAPMRIVEQMLHLPDGRRFGEVMAPFQRRDFRALFDPAGPPNRWVSRVRGASKTTDIAAAAIVDLLTAPEGSTSFAIAVDADQARLLVAAIDTWVRHSPALHGSLRVQRDVVVNTATGASLRVLASDAPSALGVIPLRVYVDEVAAQPNDRMWSSMASALHKVPGAQCTIMSTAGSPASWAYKLWQHANTSDLWLVLETNAVPPWTDARQVEDARRHLLPSVFARYFENRWTVGDSALLTPEELDDCTGSVDPKRREPGDTFTIGLDFGEVKDRSAIAVVRVGRGEAPHELVHMWVMGGTRQRRVRPSVVQEKLEELRDRFSPCTALADPYGLSGPLENLRWLKRHDFTGPSKVRLATLLLDCFRERRVLIPDDAELRGELLGLVLRETTYGYSYEDPPGGHDDRVTALNLALLQAEQRRRRDSAPTLSAEGFADVNSRLKRADAMAPHLVGPISGARLGGDRWRDS